MVLEQILEILKNDDALSLLLKPSVTDAKIYQFSTKTTCNSIVYNFVPLINDGMKEQSRLEIRANSKSYETANVILKRVKQLLITVGNDTLTNNILSVSQNGGVSKFDEDSSIYTLGAFFNVVSK